jgi:hypothetical protein
MSQLYCSRRHAWYGEFSQSVCPVCGDVPIGLVDVARYRPIIRGMLTDNVTRSVIKHGTWDGYQLSGMLWVLAGELFEVALATIRGDLYGPHGVVVELCDVATVCVKAIERLQRRLP